MGFKLPITANQLGELTGPVNIAPLLRASRARSLVKIDLYNNGDLPIYGIHIDVDQAVLYARGSEGMDDSQVLASDQSGITLDNLIQGNYVTIYVWTNFPWENYRQGDTIRISYTQGTARKNIYTECLQHTKF
jgi:hypothetical protein